MAASPSDPTSKAILKIDDHAKGSRQREAKKPAADSGSGSLSAGLSGCFFASAVFDVLNAACPCVSSETRGRARCETLRDLAPRSYTVGRAQVAMASRGSLSRLAAHHAHPRHLHQQQLRRVRGRCRWTGHGKEQGCVACCIKWRATCMRRTGRECQGVQAVGLEELHALLLGRADAGV